MFIFAFERKNIDQFMSLSPLEKSCIRPCNIPDPRETQIRRGRHRGRR